MLDAPARIEASLRRRGLEPGSLATRALAGAAVLGTVLLAVSDFTTLFEARTQTDSLPGGRVTGGANHLYVMVVIAVVAAPMAYGAIVEQARPAMLALAALALLALGIALAKDLPAASGNATLRQRGGYVTTQSTPGVGFYLETLGAALLLIAGGGSLMLATGPRRDEPEPAP